MILLTIALVTAHPGPANHFSVFSKALDEEQIPHQIIASPNVASRFDHPVVEINPSDFESIQSAVSQAECVITDVALETWATLHAWLKEQHPEIRRVCYYDNPEGYVPGGYSEVAEKVIQQADTVLFANTNLAQSGICSKAECSIDLSEKTLAGIGYYPTREAEILVSMRNDMLNREEILSRLPRKEKKTLIYLGGANTSYYEEAFPHFMSLLSRVIIEQPCLLEDTLILLQQHPRAKTDGNQDVNFMTEVLSELQLPKGFQMLASPLSTIEGLSIATGVFTYQTSMAPQLPLAGITQIAQVAKEPYNDILLQSGYPCITESSELISLLEGNAKQGSQQQVLERLGVSKDWKLLLIKALNP